MPINILSLSFIKCNEVVECFMDGVSTVLSHRCGGLGVLKILLFFPANMAECVKVIVRCRPMNTREKDLECGCVLKMDSNTGLCAITNPNDEKAPPKSFTFDGSYFTDSTTENIYSDIAYPLVEVSFWPLLVSLMVNIETIANLYIIITS